MQVRKPSRLLYETKRTKALDLGCTVRTLARLADGLPS